MFLQNKLFTVSLRNMPIEYSLIKVAIIKT